MQWPQLLVLFQTAELFEKRILVQSLAVILCSIFLIFSRIALKLFRYAAFDSSYIFDL